MEVIKFIFFAFLLIGAWSHIILPSYLDAARDQLFDLRDELREKFISNEWDISSNKYAETRTAINSYLRFTEEITFWKLFYIQYVIMNEKSNWSNEEIAPYSRRISDQSDEVDVYIAKLKHRALHVVIGYAASTSFFLNIFAFAYFPIYALIKIMNMTKRGAYAFFVSAWISFRDLPDVIVSGVAFIGRHWGNLIFKESVVEQYSMRYRYSH